MIIYKTMIVKHHKRFTQQQADGVLYWMSILRKYMQIILYQSYYCPCFLYRFKSSILSLSRFSLCYIPIQYFPCFSSIMKTQFQMKMRGFIAKKSVQKLWDRLYIALIKPLGELKHSPQELNQKVQHKKKEKPHKNLGFTLVCSLCMHWANIVYYKLTTEDQGQSVVRSLNPTSSLLHRTSCVS